MRAERTDTMAALSKVCSQIKPNLQVGEAWIAIWKEGRSWETCSFWPEGGCHETGYTFSYEDRDRMQEILRKDYKAIIVNGEHLTYDLIEGLMPLTLPNLLEVTYYNRFKQLYAFYDCYVIKD